MSAAAAARAVLDDVVDPEIPVLTIADLGILRDVVLGPAGAVEVTITPTYSGCPAMAEIRADIVSALNAAGYPDADVRTVLAPAWTTDWLTAEGRRKLVDYGIALPGPRLEGPVPVGIGRRPEVPPCPRCGSAQTRQTSRFGSTACKSMHVCAACAEPFDALKAF
ncbi:MAG: phenylacetate-CoA oxygenase subunit PaaJ [Actinomycetota bacterium]|nr:phenylacetate-CoA oxygenase subunit PaaJ [Actinomycetota bacterium]